MKLEIHRITTPIVIASVLAIGACTSDDISEEAIQPKVAVELEQKPPETPRADECCMDPGAISVCWWQDAKNDGVSCLSNSDCTTSSCVKDGLPGIASPDGAGLCKCNDNADCGDNGVCNTDTELCGPSYCNGYRLCSCFGGCVDWKSGDYTTPDDLCAAIPGAGNCCEGVYHEIPGTDLTGYCSDDPTCDGNRCTTDADCPDDGNPCTTEWCDVGTGGCEAEFNKDSCNDGNECTENDTCDIGTCAGTEVNCNDFEVCTTDSCDEAIGCVYEDNDGVACEDGDACTTDDVCLGGGCDPGPDRNCSDGNTCTTDNCDSKDFATPCFYVNNTDPCDDGDACTEFDVCGGGFCQSGAQLNCNDLNVCTNDSCNPATGCVHLANANLCEDGDACTAPDQCNSGSCVSGSEVLCNDNNLCTDDSCDVITGCEFVDNVDPCDDGDLCTISDVCAGGTCTSGPQKDCDDSNICTADSCNIDGDCVHLDIPDCCTSDLDCGDECGATGPDGECVRTECDLTALPVPECVCNSTYGVDNNLTCTLDTFAYPANCFEGQCAALDSNGDGTDDLGYCNAVELPASGNNMCRDTFQAGDPTTIDAASSGYLGSFTNATTDQPALGISGSTLCGTNNYEATGNNCTEKVAAVTNNLGYDGPDMVYVFEYQTNGPDQYQLYSYLIKVEANFNVGIYVQTDIEEADACPEGGDIDINNTHTVNSARCYYPYIGAGEVLEDLCIDGNAATGSSCCNANPFIDPFTSDVDPVTCVGTSDGDPKGYYWCRRYYPAGCCDYSFNEDCQNEPSCEGYWEYPADPHDCSFQQSMATYNNVASAVVSPAGDVDGSWRKAFIFVDGVSSGGEVAGNFYLSVERREWQANPCDRANDDIRLFDITNAGYDTSVYAGNLESSVNSTHLGGGDCGGYNCDNTAWLGGSSCHETTFQWDSGLGEYINKGNEFWPNKVYIKIDRPLGAGDERYCLETDELGPGMGDIVLSASEMTSKDSICSGWSRGLGCVHDDFVAGVGLTNYAPGDGNIKVEFEAAEGTTYIVGLSNFEERASPCGTQPGDNCNYKLSVTEGGCPVSCEPPLETAQGTIVADLASYGLITKTGTYGPVATDGDDWACAAKTDIVWVVENQTAGPLEMTFSQTPLDGFPGMIALYDCVNNELDCVDNGAGNATDSLTHTLLPNTPYYLVLEGRDTGSVSSADYQLDVTWGTPPTCVVPSAWARPYNGSIVGSVSVDGGAAIPNVLSGDSCNPPASSGNFNTLGRGFDEMWQIDLLSPSVLTFTGCTADGYGNFDTKFAIYDCEGTRIMSNDDNCAVGNDSKLVDVNLNIHYQPYYFLLDGYSTGECGAYDVGIL